MYADTVYSAGKNARILMVWRNMDEIEVGGEDEKTNHQISSAGGHRIDDLR